MADPARFALDLPSWSGAMLSPDRVYPDARSRMALAIALASENAKRGAGGPFGAAVFDARTGRLVGAGINLVLATGIGLLHAEVVALVQAQQRLGRPDLAPESGTFELVSSAEPCAMCLGAVHWSRVPRLLVGARREDVQRFGFDEGPVFPASWRYLEERGLTVTRDVMREDAVKVLEAYAAGGGPVY